MSPDQVANKRTPTGGWRPDLPSRPEGRIRVDQSFSDPPHEQKQTTSHPIPNSTAEAVSNSPIRICSQETMRLLSCLAAFVTVCAATFVPNQRCDNGREKGVPPLPSNTAVQAELKPGNGTDVRLALNTLTLLDQEDCAQWARELTRGPSNSRPWEGRRSSPSSTSRDAARQRTGRAKPSCTSLTITRCALSHPFRP